MERTINVILIGGPGAGRVFEVAPTQSILLVDHKQTCPPFREELHQYCKRTFVDGPGVELVAFVHDSIEFPIGELLRYYHANR